MNLKESWKQMLAHAEEVKQLVPVYGESHRQTGKSTALVEYAREKGYGVVTQNEHLARDLQAKTGYAYIYFQRQSLRGLPPRLFVTDEHVDTGKLKSEGCYIATGYYSVFAIN